MLGNAVAQSFQIVAMERFAPRYDARALTFLQMAVACLAFTVIAVSRGELTMPEGGTVWFALVVTGVFAGALGYLVATWVQSRTTAARAALVFTLEAPFAALFGVLLLSERLGRPRLGGLRRDARGDRARGARRGRDAPSPRAAARRRARLMDAVVLALCSAALFGGMTVALRPALARGDDPLCGALFTVIPALGVALVAAAIAGDWNVAAVWPFALAGILGPGVSQILFTLAIRDAGPSRASATVGMAPLFAVTFAALLLGEPLAAGVALGALLIVGGGIVLASESGRPEHVKTIGLVFALAGALVFALRDTFVRWVAIDTDVAPELAISATLLAGALTILVGGARRAAPAERLLVARVRARRGAVRALVRLALRGVLPRPAQHRGAARRDRVAVGRGALGAVPAPDRGRRAPPRARRLLRRRGRDPDRPLALRCDLHESDMI